LTKNEEKKLIKTLWGNTCEQGFPKNISYYKFFFLKKLSPENVDVRELFMRYIKTYAFPIQSLLNEKGVMITNGDDLFCTEMIGGLSIIELDSNDIAAMLEKLNSWFELDKKYLNEEHKNTQEEFALRFNNIIDILVSLCDRSFDNFSDNNLTMAKEFIFKMKSSGLSTIKLECVLFYKKDSERSILIGNIDEHLLSIDRKKNLQALKAIHYLIKTYEVERVLPIVELLAGKIKWRSEGYLYIAVDIFKFMYDTKQKNIPQYIHDILFSFLNCLADEAYKESIFGDNAFLDYLELRVHVAALAFSMHKYFHDEQIPSINVWRNICLSNDEFDEVKNEWGL
jgi:hypothetical protein